MLRRKTPLKRSTKPIQRKKPLPRQKKRITYRRPAMTAAEKRHVDAAMSLGCMVDDENCGGRLTYHHVRRNGAKRDHKKGFPLCDNHHQRGGYGIAIEAGKKTWEKRYGSQEEHLSRVDELLYG